MENLNKDKRYAGDSYARSLANRYKNFKIPSPRFYSGVFGYKLLYYINQPFTEWKAFKQGFIDETGRELRKPAKAEDKETYNYFVKILIKLKQQMMRTLPGQQMEKLKMLLFHVRETNFDLTLLEVLDIFEEVNVSEINDLLNELFTINIDEATKGVDVAITKKYKGKTEFSSKEIADLKKNKLSVYDNQAFDPEDDLNFVQKIKNNDTNEINYLVQKGMFQQIYIDLKSALKKLNESTMSGGIAGHGGVIGPSPQEEEDIKRKKPQLIVKKKDDDDDDELVDSNGLKFKDALKLLKGK